MECTEPKLNSTSFTSSQIRIRRLCMLKIWILLVTLPFRHVGGHATNWSTFDQSAAVFKAIVSLLNCVILYKWKCDGYLLHNFTLMLSVSYWRYPWREEGITHAHYCSIHHSTRRYQPCKMCYSRKNPSDTFCTPLVRSNWFNIEWKHDCSQKEKM